MPDTSSTDAAADAALAEVLGEPPAADDGGGWDAAEAEILSGDVPARRGEGEVADCTADEARALVGKAIAAIMTINETMEAIIRRRAWLALGYDDPRTFWIKEFGPKSENPAFSVAQVYRTARVLGLVYEIQQRLGDAEVVVSITERALRSIPAGPEGVNDVALVDAIEAGVAQLGDDFTPEDVQDVVDKTVQRARQAYAADQPEMPKGDLAARLDALGLSPSSLTADDLGDDDADPIADDAVVPVDDYTPESAAQPVLDAGDDEDRTGVSLSAQTYDEDALAVTFRVQKLRGGIDALAETLPGDINALIDRLSLAEKEVVDKKAQTGIQMLDQYIAKATKARATLAATAEAAEVDDDDVELDV